MNVLQASQRDQDADCCVSDALVDVLQASQPDHDVHDAECCVSGALVSDALVKESSKKKKKKKGQVASRALLAALGAGLPAGIDDSGAILDAEAIALKEKVKRGAHEEADVRTAAYARLEMQQMRDLWHGLRQNPECTSLRADAARRFDAARVRLLSMTVAALD